MHFNIWLTKFFYLSQPIVDNKARTHKKNNKSDIAGFPFVLKQINLSVNHGEKSKSRNFGRDSEVLQTIIGYDK